MTWYEIRWDRRKVLSANLADYEKVALQTRRVGRGKSTRIVSHIAKQNIKWRQLLNVR